MLDAFDDTGNADFGDDDALEIDELDVKALDVEFLQTLLLHSGLSSLPEFMAALSDAGINLSYGSMFGVSRALKQADEYNGEVAQPALWTLDGDASDHRFPMLALHKEDGGEWIVIPRPQEYFPEVVRTNVIDRWRSEREGGGLKEVVALCRATQTSIELKRLYDLAGKRRSVPQLWQYTYDVKPEAFDGCLPLIHSILTNSSRTVSKRDARLVCEETGPGVWQLVSEAVWNIDLDYKTALDWASREGEVGALERLGTFDATVDRYQALVGLANDSGLGSRLEKAIRKDRSNATTVTPVSKPTIRTELAGQGVGQGHFSDLILRVCAGELTPSISWGVNGTEKIATLKFVATTDAPKIFDQIKDDVLLTDGGIMSILGAVYQVWTRSGGREKPSTQISTANFVREHRATHMSEQGRKHKTSDYRNAMRDIDSFLLALSRIHVDVEYYELEERKGHRKVGVKRKAQLGPLFKGSHFESVIDPSGNTIESAWTLTPESMDFFEMNALVWGEKVPLVESGQGVEGHRLTSLQSAFYTFVYMAVRNLEWQVDHKQGNTVHFDKEDLIYLGKCRPPEPTDPEERKALRRSERRRLDRLSKILLDHRGAVGPFLQDIMRTLKSDPASPTIDIRVRTKAGNRRKVGKGDAKREKPPKIKIDGLDITLLERGEGTRKLEARKKSDLPSPL